MVFFIDFLKALASCLITNAHYTGIYPTDLIANGGLIGDILFFAVSGWCLYRIREPFLKWYAKRLYRCYLSVILITGIYLLLGFYSLEENSFFWWFLYPTAYHFVSSIVLLYIPYYCVMVTPWLRKRLPALMLAVFGFGLLIYLTWYDKSYYHIDNVREPMIRILFFESMLLGAWFRQNDACLRGVVHWWHFPAALLAFCAYFASKLLFSRLPQFSEWQIMNQILIFILLFLIFRAVAGINPRLEQMPERIKHIVRLLSEITLEIYVVQYVLIDKIRPLAVFPFNWLLLTVSIILAAVVLHRICAWLSPARLSKWFSYARN